MGESKVISSIWAWVKELGPVLLAVERIVLTVAGLSGLLAFWQFIDERDARQIERAAALTSALIGCEEIEARIPEAILEEGVEITLTDGTDLTIGHLKEVAYACDYVIDLNDALPKVFPVEDYVIQF